MESKEIRKWLELDIVSMNTPLREAVKTMEWIQLLRNCHPLHREYYARKLYLIDEITREEAREFIIF